MIRLVSRGTGNSSIQVQISWVRELAATSKCSIILRKNQLHSGNGYAITKTPQTCPTYFAQSVLLKN